MDVQKTPAPTRLGLRRFLSREFFCGAESRGAALVYSALAFVVALLFARTHALFGMYPFALGLLAAADRRVPLLFAGACIGALTVDARGYIYIVAYLIVVLLRLFLSHPRAEGRLLPACAEYFEEAPALRSATACVGGLFLAVYQLLAGGLGMASLQFSCMAVLLPTLFCMAAIGYFSSGRMPYDILEAAPAPWRQYGDARAWYEALGVAALCLGLVHSAGGSALFGISLSLALSAFFALFFPVKWGTLRGGAAAVLIALGTGELLYLPAYAAMACLSGLLRHVGNFYSLAVGCLAGCALAFALRGNEAVLSFLPEAIVSAVLTWPLFRNLAQITRAGQEKQRRASAQGEDAAARYRPVMEHIRTLSGAYASLSDIFRCLSDAAGRPSEAEYRAACQAVFDHHCQGCAGQGGCWERGDKNAARALDCLAEQYSRGTPPAEIRVPESLMRSCGCFPRMREEVRTACATLEENKRRCEKNGVFSQTYAMTAEVLADAVRRETGEEREDRALGREAARVFAEAGIPVRRVSVCGARHRVLLASGVRWNAQSDDAVALRHRLEEVLHCRLSEATFEAQEGVMCLRMESVHALCPVVHQASASRSREVSGDAFSTFEGNGGYHYALLSDGMGSGQEAAVTSGICGAFLAQMLAAGTSKGTALKALNTVLCQRGNECSATIDLLELDLIYGKACFVKSGAAASYVKRGDNLFRIRSSTVPIGILQALDAEKIRFDVREGDVVILLSDGISQAPDDAAWLCEMLCNAWDPDGDAMAERILEGARSHSETGDDMTVALIEIRAA